MEAFTRTPTRASGPLTEQEREAMRLITQRWIRNAFQTGHADLATVTRDITALYAAASFPPPRVVLIPSPLVMAYAYGLALTWWKYHRNIKIPPYSTRDATWYATRDATWAATGDATRDATRDATGDATRDATWAATGDATGDATGEATWDATWAATGDATRDATRDATWAATGDATWVATANKTFPNWMWSLAKKFCGKYASNAIDSISIWRQVYQGGNMWSGFPAYAEAMRDVLKLTGLPCWKNYAAWEACAKSGGFRVLHPQFCLVTDFPEQLHVDDQQRPHCEHGPSHRWWDGWSLYHLHGVRFTKALYERVISRTMPMAEILSMQDIDQRVQAIKFAAIGIREFYRAEGGKVIDTHDKQLPDRRPVHYELWRIPKGRTFTQDVTFALYTCPSSLKRGEIKEYTKGVPDFNTVAEAMSWGMSDETHRVTPQQWKALQPLVDEA